MKMSIDDGYNLAFTMATRCCSPAALIKIASMIFDYREGRFQKGCRILKVMGMIWMFFMPDYRS